jgi:hypothetical protein
MIMEPNIEGYPAPACHFMLHPALLATRINDLGIQLQKENLKAHNKEEKQDTIYLCFLTDDTGWPLRTQSFARLRSLKLLTTG